MKCLSLKQPFAELVVSGRKTIELRTWNTKFRGEFLVHASGNADTEACALFNMNPEKVVRKVVVGKATIYDVKEYKDSGKFLADRKRHLATDKYSGSRYGFLLKDVVRFDNPINMPGRLGFFEVELGV